MLSGKALLGLGVFALWSGQVCLAQTESAQTVATAPSAADQMQVGRHLNRGNPRREAIPPGSGVRGTSLRHGLWGRWARANADYPHTTQTEEWSPHGPVTMLETQKISKSA